MGIRVRQSHFYISHLAECIVIDFSPVVRRHSPPYARRDYARKKGLEYPVSFLGRPMTVPN